ncbi:carboxypeptidase regulatory-like domain-containing protein, partial [Siccirubricoccus sp. KC 17139]
MATSYADVIDDGLKFSNITASESVTGTANSFTTDAVTVAGAPSVLGNAIAGLRWTGFVAGATGPGSSYTLTLDYDISTVDPARALSAISTNSFIPDSSVAAGVTVKLSEAVYSTSGTLLAQSTLTKTQSATDTADPPIETGDALSLGGAYSSVHVTITISISIASSAASGTVASFSSMTQGYTTTAASPAGLGDFVFEHSNANGLQDAGEAGIAGVTVQLLNAAGTVVATTTTAADGSYGFTGQTPGTYSVHFVTPAGYVPTSANQGGDDAKDSDAVGGTTQQVTLSSGEYNGTLDAGFYKPAGLGDFVFEDSNANGVQDAGEAGIAGVTVELLNAAGTVVATTTTAADGSYGFTGQTPGTYSVHFVTPAGYVPTSANQGGDDAKDSDA